MSFASPGNMSPGGSFRAAPYSRVVTLPLVAPASLSNGVLPNPTQAPNSTSGALVVITTTGTFSWKDAAGVTSSLTLPAGTYDFAMVAMSTLEISTAVGFAAPY